MQSTKLVLANFESLIWVVIIVGSLIAQVVKSFREKKELAKPSSSPRERQKKPPVFKDAQTQLEEFLESLSGGSGKHVAPKPVTQTLVPKDSNNETITTDFPAKSPPPVPQKITPIKSSTNTKTPVNRSASLRIQKASSLRKQIESDLINPLTLRKAILLQEIMDKPISLKSHKGPDK